MAFRAGTLVPTSSVQAPRSLSALKVKNEQISPAIDLPVDTPGIVDDGARTETGVNRVASPAFDLSCLTVQRFYFSDDRGTTWKRQCLEPVDGLLGYGGATVAYGVDPSTVDAYIFGIDADSSGLNGEIVYEKTTDNGTTWGAPAVAVPATYPGGFTDEPRAEVDHNPGSPFQGAIYLSITQFDSTLTKSRISLSRSTDGGATWTTSFPSAEQTAPDVAQFSDLAVGPDGTVYVSWMQCTAGGPTDDCGGQAETMMVARSTDGGTSWGPPITTMVDSAPPDTNGIDFYGTLPGTNEPLTNIPAIDVETGGSSPGFVCHDATNFTEDPHLAVMVTCSSDGGITWSSPVSVVPSGRTDDQFLPWLSVSPTGVIATTWLDRKMQEEIRKVRGYIAFSSDGGATWTRPKPIATAFSGSSLNRVGAA